MSPDEERLVEALAVERLYGAQAPLFVAARIGDLALAGDEAGIERWRAIARRLAALQGLDGGYGRIAPTA
ncbi:DUF6961 family protein [Sphingomonas montanisoli]|uniref:DUF6961 family protein n=1 Tax=Sphingomonas montanisoli TaxID=2606412 RepID=UPI001FE2F7DD|nr:hypothetical protein [Sphingomonas montanisoli]